MSHLQINLFIFKSINQSINLRIYLLILKIWKLIYLKMFVNILVFSICKSNYIFIYLRMYSSIFETIYLSVNQTIYLSIYECIHLYLKLSIYLWIYFLLFEETVPSIHILKVRQHQPPFIFFYQVSTKEAGNSGEKVEKVSDI